MRTAVTVYILHARNIDSLGVHIGFLFCILFFFCFYLMGNYCFIWLDWLLWCCTFHSFGCLYLVHFLLCGGFCSGAHRPFSGSGYQTPAHLMLLVSDPTHLLEGPKSLLPCSSHFSHGSRAVYPTRPNYLLACSFFPTNY